MTKGEAIRIVEGWLTYAEAGDRIGSENKAPPVAAIKRVLQEARKNNG